MSCRRVDPVEVGDIGQGDEDRIASVNVTRLAVATGFGDRKEDAIPGSQRMAGGQGEDRPETPAPLDF
jgi:hypothetical protein